MAVELKAPAARTATHARASAARAPALSAPVAARRLDRLPERVGTLPPLAASVRPAGADVLSPSRPPGVLQRCGPAGCECGGACGSPETAPPVQRLMMSAPDAASEVEAEMLAPRLASGRPGPMLQRAPAEGTLPVPAHVEAGVARMEGGGAPLDSATRATMERGLGTDLGHVRVHSGPEVTRLARAVDARAFTVGSDVFMGGSVSTSDVLAHELVHVAQQGPALSRRTLHRRWPFRRKQPAVQPIADARDPSTWKDRHRCCPKGYCDVPERKDDEVPTKFVLTIAVDRERSNVAKGFITGDVGHTWVKFSSDGGELSSYGLYPRRGFNPLLPSRTVDGCIHHPDVAHEGINATDYKEINYELDLKDWDRARRFAVSECKRNPGYNLFKNNCTTFAVECARTAGVVPPASTWMAIDNPNAIYEGIEGREAEEKEAFDADNERIMREQAAKLALRFGPAVQGQ